jgi:dihydropteroate synthase
MGILNVTPDSFSDGGKYDTIENAVKQAFQMIEDGVDIIDIGGESTRPGAKKVSLEEELNRVIPVIKRIRQESDISISIDTYKSEVANKAIQAGANIVNDISGLRFDKKMIDVISKSTASAVLMHIQGTPESMQDNPIYRNLLDEILKYLGESTDMLLQNGVEKARIAIDPGIGFGKKWEDNYKIIRYLKELKSLGFPILLGASRKSFIGNLLDLPADERLEGSLAAAACGIMNGADILRVHDVKETCRLTKVTDKIVGKN